MFLDPRSFNGMQEHNYMESYCNKYRESNDKFTEFYLSDDYETYIIEYTGDILKAFEKIDYAAITVTGPVFALVAAPKGELNRLLDDIPEIIYVENSFPYTLSPSEVVDTNSYYNFMEGTNSSLNGEGVIVGIISTGIDYLNPRFTDVTGNTRVIAIWDQTLQQGPKPSSIAYGTEFSSENINDAIKLKNNGGDPYTIVNHRDEKGDGTSIAGIIGGRKLDPKDLLVSAAPKCEFAIVKLKNAKKSTLELNGIDKEGVDVYESADIRTALLYLSELQIKENKPMVIYTPFGSNIGGHDGDGPIERFIDSLIQRRGLEAVGNTGAEAMAHTHTSGVISSTGKEQIIEISVDPRQKDLYFIIWAKRPDKISIGLTPPTGNGTGRIPAIFTEGEEVRIQIGSNVATVRYHVSFTNGDQYIGVLIRNVQSGVWKVNVYGDYIVNGRYDVWLFQRYLLYENTKFLINDPFITLRLPSTAVNVLATSYYDSKTRVPVPMSGRGFTRDGRIKPDVCTGGTDILTTGLEGKDIVISGAAAAGAIVCGAVALVMQWGLVQGNDKNLFTPKIRSYIIKSVIEVDGVIYPNPQCGYGMLDFKKLYETLGVL